MDKFTLLIEHYSYWILIFGALIEGESILLMAGGAAYFGYFSLPVVMLVSFVGAVIHDQLLYAAGRFGGHRLIQRFAFLQKKADRAFDLLNKYDIWLIMSFRFIYGVRTITPIVIGASKLSFVRYTTLTVISAAIWASAISLAGYFFANMIQSLADVFHEYQMYLALVVVILVAGGFGIYFYKKEKKPEQERGSPSK